MKYIKQNGIVHEVFETTPNGYWVDWGLKTFDFIPKSRVDRGEAILTKTPFINREYLADFIKLNNIKKTRVSLYLGMSENWLTTMVNEKRRGDLSGKTLQEILKKLHIEWTSKEFIQVKKTKEHTAYKTQPCNYSRAVDKERLQRSMWNGEFVV